MNLHITKSKNAESFYIAKSYTKANGKTSSVIVRKLGTLNQLIVEHGPTRDDVLAWAKNEVKLETEKYKKEETDTYLYYFMYLFLLYIVSYISILSYVLFHGSLTVEYQEKYLQVL